MAYVGVDDGGSLRVVEDPAQVPGYRTVVSSPESLKMVATVDQMDDLRRGMLGVDVVSSRGPEEAAARLWYLVELYGSRKSSGVFVAEPGEGNGTRAMGLAPRDSTRHEMIKLNYTPGKMAIRDKLYSKLSHQARTIVEILLEDGRMVWPEQAVRSLVEENQQRFKTDRPSLEIYRFYRSRLIDGNYLKRLTYSEFAQGVAFPTSARP